MLDSLDIYKVYLLKVKYDIFNKTVSLYKNSHVKCVKEVYVKIN